MLHLGNALGFPEEWDLMLPKDGKSGEEQGVWARRIGHRPIGIKPVIGPLLLLELSQLCQN